MSRHKTSDYWLNLQTLWLRTSAQSWSTLYDHLATAGTTNATDTASDVCIAKVCETITPNC